MPRVKKKKYDTIKVKNISNGLINLTYSSIKPNETGEATKAELACHGKKLEEMKITSK